MMWPKYYIFPSLMLCTNFFFSAVIPSTSSLIFLSVWEAGSCFSSCEADSAMFFKKTALQEDKGKYPISSHAPLANVRNGPGKVDKVCKVEEKFNLPGLVNESLITIGGLFPIHFRVVEPDLTFKTHPESLRCEGFNFRAFRWVQTMIFTIDEINRDQNLLPNVTLGYRIFDSCDTHFQALRAAVTLINGQEDSVSDYDCAPSTLAIIGDSGSTQSLVVTRMLGLFRIPLVSYFSTCACLSDKAEYPAFLRTVPSDYFQIRALAQLVKHFGWTWVGTIAGDDAYGRYGIQMLSEQVEAYGVCIAFSQTIPKVNTKEKIEAIGNTIQKSRAKVILVFAIEQDMARVVQEVARQNITGIQWIASEAWVTSAMLSSQDNAILTGTLGFALRRAQIPNLQQFLQKIHPSTASQNTFVIEFWETLFHCSLQTSGNGTNQCTGSEDLETRVNIYSDVSQLRVSYNVYKGIYAIAHALHDLFFCENGKGPFGNNSCANTVDIKPWQLLHYLKHVNFTDRIGEEVLFDANGDPIPSYDLINWQRDADGSVQYVTVGQFGGSLDSNHKLQIEEGNIVWNNGKKEVPQSTCSAGCGPGTRKAVREGQPVCCFDCIPCADGEISNQTDSIECIKCHLDYWPNSLKDRCLLKEVEFLSFGDAMGISLVTIALCGTSLTIGVAAVFTYYRNTPIVKANNSELSFLILFSLVLCFLCSLTFIGQPTIWSCMLRHTLFCISFVLCISCILGKTIVVLMAFRATLPNSGRMKWFGLMQQRTVILLCTCLQIVICILWLTTSPPLPVKNTKYQNAKIILECDVGSIKAFAFTLGYISILSSLCFLLAFFARKLPDNFNEAKFITFSMLIFFTVWVTFIPAYVSTPGKYTVAVEIFAILASSFGLLFSIFVPRCYIILFKPEQNTRKHLMCRMATGKKL
ncbi:extracellular calcium-sensing receptor-like [Heterodontus francisci]|uniref:extracellular calcium-sensing receptor-like n=1 Tax=Heterodontus francisci TaxID=7792 RepID=UPI00355BA296